MLNIWCLLKNSKGVYFRFALKAHESWFFKIFTKTDAMTKTMTMTLAKGYSLNVQYKVRWPKQKPAKQENLSGEPWYQVNPLVVFL